MNTTPKGKKHVEYTGVITRVFYSTPQFSTGILNSKSPWMDVKFAGKFLAKEGSEVTLVGYWKDNPPYGKQLVVDHIKINIPVDDAGVRRYLASNPDFYGIGPATADRIIKASGNDFDAFITQNLPEIIAQKAGITIDIAKTLKDTWEENKIFNTISTKLSSWGLTHNQVKKLVLKFGNSCYDVLVENPYILIDMVKNFGFSTVDEIALKTGVNKTNANRIKAGVVHAIKNHIKNGNCYIQFSDLLTNADKLLALDGFDNITIIREAVSELIYNQKLICEDEEFLTTSDLYEKELYLFNTFKKAQVKNPHFEYKEKSFAFHDSLLPNQEKAVINFLKHNISLISGGAGTGKSYTIAKIYDLCNEAGLDIILSAPTGKAARRLEEVSNSDGITVHRLLGYDGTNFAFNEDEKLRADVIIVDECSMMDVELMCNLFKAIDFDHTALILVGDHNQLPAVGPGNIIRDLVKSEFIPSTVLNECVRQSGKLKHNCNSILSGKLRHQDEKIDDYIDNPDEKNAWFLLNKYHSQENALSALLTIVNNSAEKIGFDPLNDVQVLAPKKDGTLGVKNLNIELQKIIQLKKFGVTAPDTPEKKKPKLLVGDKVIQMKNDYGMEVMNGTIGSVAELKPDGSYVMNFNDTLFTMKKGCEQLRHIELAYALTIHKSQGSEFPCVIVVAHSAHSFMLHRNLLYTGVTRASKTAIIIGDSVGAKTAINKKDVDKRKTFLSLWTKARGNS